MKFLQCFDWAKYDEARKAAKGVTAQAAHEDAADKHKVLAAVAKGHGQSAAHEHHTSMFHEHLDAAQAHKRMQMYFQ